MDHDEAVAMLSIHVVQAENLYNVGSDGSDPYVVVQYSGHELQTEFEASTCAPIWDARFEVRRRIARQPKQTQHRCP